MAGLLTACLCEACLSKKGNPMEKWHQMGDKVRRFVNPATFPVAVRFIRDASEIPPSARRPLQNLQVRMAPCQGAAMARRYALRRIARGCTGNVSAIDCRIPRGGRPARRGWQGSRASLRGEEDDAFRGCSRRPAS